MIRRYTHVWDTGDIHEAENGEWVRWADVQHLFKEPIDEAPANQYNPLYNLKLMEKTTKEI